MSILTGITKDIINIVVDDLDEYTVKQLIRVLIDENPRLACSILLRIIKVFEDERQHISDSIQRILDNIHFDDFND